MRRRHGKLRERILRTARGGPSMTVQQLARRVGCHPSTVQRHLRGLRLGPRPAAVQVEAASVAQLQKSGPVHDATAKLLRSGIDARAAAGRYSTDATVLGRLAHDAARSVRHELAGNRSCPRAGLRLLAEEGLARVQHIDTPKLMRRIVANPSCDPGLLAAVAARSPDMELRAAVYAHPNCPRPLLRAAPGRVDGRIREAAARNPNCPRDVLIRLAGDVHNRVRRHVAGHPALPACVMTLLAADTDEWVVHQIASRDDCTPEALAAAAAASDAGLATAGIGDVQRRVAQHPNTPPQALRVLAGSPIEMVRYEVASRGGLPVDAVVGLASDPDSWMVRAVAARNPRCPPQTAAAAAADPDWRVRESAAAAVNLPRAALDGLADDPAEQVRCRARWLRRALDDPGSVLSDPEPAPRHVAARYARCPPGLLTQLAADPDIGVRISAVSNHRCPAEGLRRAVEATAADHRVPALAADAARVVELVAAHPNCPQQLAGGP